VNLFLFYPIYSPFFGQPQWGLEDNDRPDVGAARLNQTSENGGIFGMFFLAQPDLELANFAIEELEEILWTWMAEFTRKVQFK
jgi:hypothetical protein